MRIYHQHRMWWVTVPVPMTPLLSLLRCSDAKSLDASPLGRCPRLKYWRPSDVLVAKLKQNPSPCEKRLRLPTTARKILMRVQRMVTGDGSASSLKSRFIPCIYKSAQSFRTRIVEQLLVNSCFICWQQAATIHFENSFYLIILEAQSY